jgi:hypothetical protein
MKKPGQVTGFTPMHTQRPGLPMSDVPVSDDRAFWSAVGVSCRAF